MTRLRYWLFGYDYCYPNGGMNDLLGRYKTWGDAKAAAEASDCSEFDVADVVDGVDRQAVRTPGEPLKWSPWESF